MEINQTWIDEMRALCNAATPSPWESMHYGRYEDHDECCIALPDDSIEPSKYENADFIATARTALPAALDALEAAYAEIERLRTEFDAERLKRPIELSGDAATSFWLAAECSQLQQKIASLTAERDAEKRRADAADAWFRSNKQELVAGGFRFGELASCAENAPSGTESEANHAE